MNTKSENNINKHVCQLITMHLQWTYARKPSLVSIYKVTCNESITLYKVKVGLPPPTMHSHMMAATLMRTLNSWVIVLVRLHPNNNQLLNTITLILKAVAIDTTVDLEIWKLIHKFEIWKTYSPCDITVTHDESAAGLVEMKQTY